VGDRPAPSGNGASTTDIGTLLLMPADPTDLVEVGWHLHPRHQGNGFATEAAQATA